MRFQSKILQVGCICFVAFSGLFLSAFTAQQLLLLSGGTNFFPGATIHWKFYSGEYLGGDPTSTTSLTFSRGSATGTNLLPQSPIGAAYTTFQQDKPRIIAGTGKGDASTAGGMLSEAGPKTQLLPNASNPALCTPTCTTQSLTSGTVYTLWGNGTGNVTLTGAPCLGTGAASQGVPVTFTAASTGTCVVTVVGSLNVFQLEQTAWATSFINAPAGGARGNELADFTTLPTLGAGYSIYAAFIPLAPDLANVSPMVGVGIDDGSNVNRLQVFDRQTAGQQIGRAVNCSGTTGTCPADLGNSTWAYNTLSKLLVTTTQGAQTFYYNGQAPVLGTDNIPVGMTTMRIGRGFQAANVHCYCLITEIAFFPIVVPQAQGQSFTTLNFLLNRDLDPVANDNMPAFLEYVA